MEKITLRTWQKVAVERSDKQIPGIFLEGRGGKGKTFAALFIAQHKGAKRVMVLNNQTAILEGWTKTIKEHFDDQGVEYIIKTEKWLAKQIRMLHQAEEALETVKKQLGSRKLYHKSIAYNQAKQVVEDIQGVLTVDVLVIDEWQNMCSDVNVKNYKKIKRDYSIGLSATPIREKGQNFYPLEKTFYGKAEPNQRIAWTKHWGQMVYDSYSYTKETWVDFKDYELYISRLDAEQNFMRWEEINDLENSEVNNGFAVKVFRPQVEIPEQNIEKLQMLRRFNLVEVEGQFAMPKAFGRSHFERYLKQAQVSVDFPKLRAKDAPSPLFEILKGMIARAPHGLLIVGESREIIRIIYEQNKGPGVGLWTGEDRISHEDAKVLIATSGVLGVGVDGLQHRFETMVVLDPIQDMTSGRYDDYRQLLWRVIGDRQVHDVNVVEVQYKMPE